MFDAADLALALAGAGTVDESVRAYENVILPRSADIAKMLEGRAESLISDELPDFSDDNDERP